jgi:Zn-finger protein
MECANSFRYFANRACGYFPCHGGGGGAFNCLFCFCPLYPAGADCGGDFRVLPGGGKDCSDCLYPHIPENYEEILGKLRDFPSPFPRAAEPYAEPPDGDGTAHHLPGR